MLQHLLMTSVAAALFAASGLGTLALRVASPDVRQRYLLPFLHSRLMSALTFPVVGLVIYALTMWATHFTTLYNLALLVANRDTTDTVTTASPGARETTPTSNTRPPATPVGTSPPDAAAAPSGCVLAEAAFCEDFEGERGSSAGRNGDVSLERFSLAAVAIGVEA